MAGLLELTQLILKLIIQILLEKILEQSNFVTTATSRLIAK